ncbi:hypothetical protein [Litchfieldia salsa]|uniref:Uncharacterized protein n=1 Tax=Litchfieldia salsa TaxID=930152 RepID=A0A1H0UMD3_9BACI|nr:hypothetical protein SAMN05216565_10539 [Litchfieldia salsa]
MNYYDMCCRYKGRTVTITDKAGKQHCGRIVDVTRTHVYIAPQGGRNLGGFSYGFYGGWGYRPYAVPLAFIGGLALGAAFFW